jgi:hypothetical protein
MPALCPARISGSSSLLAATMNQKFSLREVPQFVSLKCSPKLGQRELEFSGVKAHAGRGADEPFNSDIGALLPIALCGRTSL